MTSDSDSDSFKSVRSRSPSPTASSPPSKLNPQEEAARKTESQGQKTAANAQFAAADYSSALQGYDKALASLPTYLDFEIAVLKSNIAACQLKVQEWKEAEKAAGQGLDCLERVDPESVKLNTTDGRHGHSNETESEHGRIQEVDDVTAEVIESLEERTGHTHAEIQRIRIKLRLRRAKAREELGGWQALEGANEDYQILLKMGSGLSGLDERSVRKALATLPSKLEAAKSREMGEMMGKLKDLGNGILKPFGLSTDNFKLQQQEGGGYSVQFDQNQKT